MCRKGRMFAPTKTWRRWHRKINLSQKRYAVASALAASAVPALVMARGHDIDQVPEIPLVLDNSLESLTKTSAAKTVLAAVGAWEDVEKAMESKKIRPGKGKSRNRRYVLRRGPLIIYSNPDTTTIEQAFRNLPGVELCHVQRLNLLQLAPGGHMGRFCVWSQSAMEALNTLYNPELGGKRIPMASMTHADLARIINSDEVQSVLNPAQMNNVRRLRKRNAIRNVDALERLDPYAAAARRAETLAMEQRAQNKSDILKKKRLEMKEKKQYKEAGKEFYEKVSKQGSVCENGFK